jgi:diaminohydroxyphosphoribosylaminopyrimidine deaminase / 5-amino-6-(5-phosphoribosylamino)uracil reductase
VREIPPGARVLDDTAETVVLPTRDPEQALTELFARDRQHVFLEGGPTLAAAFLAAGLVDEVVTYVAPMLLGSGRSAVADLGIGTIADALHLDVTDVTVLGEGADTNVRLTMTPRKAGS